MKTWFVLLFFCLTAAAEKQQKQVMTPLEAYIQQSSQGVVSEAQPRSGSLWSPDARFGNLSSDLRARSVNDILTIIVQERASAVSRGSVSASRNSSAKARVDAAAGAHTTGWLPNLANLSSERKLDGQGETVRETVLNTVLTARVTQVMPNGNLIIEGTKTVTVNSEAQKVVVRGVVRPYDLSTGNAVRSDQIAMLEVSVAGRGVIGDAVRQPNILYRILLGILPF